MTSRKMYLPSIPLLSFLTPCRWLLVQLLHWLELERGFLPLRWAHEEHRWDHLVRMARAQLLSEKGGDESPASGFSTISAAAVNPGSRSYAKHYEISLIPVKMRFGRERNDKGCLVNFQSDECYVLPCLIVNCSSFCVFISKIFYFLKAWIDAFFCHCPIWVTGLWFLLSLKLEARGSVLVSKSRLGLMIWLSIKASYCLITCFGDAGKGPTTKGIVLHCIVEQFMMEVLDLYNVYSSVIVISCERNKHIF